MPDPQLIWLPQHRRMLLASSMGFIDSYVAAGVSFRRLRRPTAVGGFTPPGSNRRRLLPPPWDIFEQKKRKF